LISTAEAPRGSAARPSIRCAAFTTSARFAGPAALSSRGACAAADRDTARTRAMAAGRVDMGAEDARAAAGRKRPPDAQRWRRKCERQPLGRPGGTVQIFRTGLRWVAGDG